MDKKALLDEKSKSYEDAYQLQLQYSQTDSNYQPSAFKDFKVDYDQEQPIKEVSERNSENSQQTDQNQFQKQYALVDNPKVPKKWRILVPIILFINISMFIWCNLDLGVQVNLFVEVKVLEKPIPLAIRTNHFTLKEFGLFDTFRDMWDAKVYPLAILVLVFSGIWPYIKLTTLLYCWCINESKLSPRVRERLLIILDILGKWSLLDSYVLIMMTVAFRFQIQENLKKYAGEQAGDLAGELSVYVLPLFGFYLFLVATALSLVITHIIIHYHRKINEKGDQKFDETKEKLSENTKQSKIYIGLSIIIVAGILFLVGSFIKCFSVIFMGAAGWILPTNKKEASYSLMTLGQMILQKSIDQAFGFYFLCGAYFVFTVFVPIAFLILLSILWIKPMTISQQIKLFSVTEILNAWSGVEVFVVTILASVMQIQQFASFMLGKNCDAINEWIKELKTQKVIELSDEEGTKCFDTKVSLEPGFIVLFVSAFFYLIAGTKLLRKCQYYLQLRIDKFQGTQSELIVKKSKKKDKIAKLIDSKQH